MADITITVTADQQQALQGLEAVKKKADELAESQRKVQEASDAAATDSMNSIGTVSREVAQTISQTGDALSTISGGIKTAGTEAGRVAGAFGKSIPVIGQIGSAIATAITGPVGAVSAAVGLAIAGIMKMINAAKEQVELLKMSAEGRTNAAYEQVMKGRQDYADQLAVLAQVREINRYAQENKLTTDQLAQFRQLASQIGIAERDVGDRGIRSGKLGEAARSLRQHRDFYAEQEYNDYLDAMQKQLSAAIQESGLSDAMKRKLAPMSALSRADFISSMARTGSGWNTEEYKAWQDLYALIKLVNEVRTSYNRDKMLGRSQAELNAETVQAFEKAARKKEKEEAAGKSGGSSKEKPLWQQQDEADRAAFDDQKARAEREKKYLEGLDRQIQLNELIADDKKKEAFLLKNRMQYEDILGQKLTEAQIAEIDARSERLYALQNPAEPELAPEDPLAPVRSRAASRAAEPVRLNSLQRVGANLRGAAAISPEKQVLDKSYLVQENIYRLLQSAPLTHPDTAIMRF